MRFWRFPLSALRNVWPSLEVFQVDGMVASFGRWTSVGITCRWPFLWADENEMSFWGFNGKYLFVKKCETSTSGQEHVKVSNFWKIPFPEDKNVEMFSGEGGRRFERLIRFFLTRPPHFSLSPFFLWESFRWFFWSEEKDGEIRCLVRVTCPPGKCHFVQGGNIWKNLFATFEILTSHRQKITHHFST